MSDEQVPTHWMRFVALRDCHMEVLRALDALRGAFRSTLSTFDPEGYNPKDRVFDDRNDYVVGMDYGAYVAQFWMKKHLEKREEVLERKIAELGKEVEEEYDDPGKLEQRIISLAKRIKQKGKDD